MSVNNASYYTNVGDVQLISNHSVVHARTAYEDVPGSERHLLRLWLSLER